MISKITIPMLLILPVVLLSIPIKIKISIFITTIIFIGTFGSTVGLVKIKESKMIERLKLLPISKYKLVLHYILAKSITDSLKFIIPLIVLILANLNMATFKPTDLFALFLCFCCVILVSNALGTIIGSMSQSSSNAHLYALILVLLISVISGTFDTMNLFPNQIIAKLFPFQYFSSILLHFLDKSPNTAYYIAPISTLVFLILAMGSSKKLFYLN